MLNVLRLALRPSGGAALVVFELLDGAHEPASSLSAAEAKRQQVVGSSPFAKTRDFIHHIDGWAHP